MTTKRPPDSPRKPERRHMLTKAFGLSAAWASIAGAQPAPISIRATLLDGQAFSSDSVKGKVVLINFWATWCAPCRAEMPEIDAYYRHHQAQGLEVLALSMDELADAGKVRDVAKAYTFPVAMMKTAQLTGLGRIWRMPVSAVIDRQGRLVKQDWFIQPKLDAAALDAVIKPLL